RRRIDRRNRGAEQIWLVLHLVKNTCHLVHLCLFAPWVPRRAQLLLTGDSAQNADQAASSAKNLAKERIGFSLSSRKPCSSSSRSRFSYKSLPNTCVSCEYR